MCDLAAGVRSRGDAIPAAPPMAATSAPTAAGDYRSYLLLVATEALACRSEDFATYFPEREAVVLYIDLASIRASGLLDKLVGSTLGESPEYRSFIQQTGFDYKRDLNHAMLNSAGGIHYFVLQGKFDWPKLKAYAISQGGSCNGDYCHTKGSTPDRVISWRQLRQDVMALATARDEAGARAIDRRSEAPVPFVVPSTPIWLHVPASALRSVDQLPPGTRVFAKALETAERAVFTLGPERDQFALGADVVCRTPEEAAVLRTQLEGLTKMLSSLIARENKTPSATDLSGLLTSGHFVREDRHVRARWSVQRAFLDSLGGA